jgi:hypothetical protein
VTFQLKKKNFPSLQTKEENFPSNLISIIISDFTGSSKITKKLSQQNGLLFRFPFQLSQNVFREKFITTPFKIETENHVPDEKKVI